MTTDKSGSVPNGGNMIGDVRRLRRRTTDRVIGGVAGGMADYLNVDPLLLRVGFVGLMIFGGAGLVLYVIAWLLIPVAGRDEPIIQEWFEWLSARLGNRTALVAVLLLVLGGIWYLGQAQPCLVSLDDPYTGECIGGDFGWLSSYEPVSLRNAALIAIGVMVVGFAVLRWRGGSGGKARNAHDTATASLPMDASAGAPPATEPWAATSATSTQVAPGSAIRAPRSPLGWYTLAAALMAIGLLAMIGNAPGLRVGLGQYFGAALAVLGLGLVVGAWWGRARSLILLGLVVLPVGLTASFITVPLDGGIGEQMFHPRTVGELRSDYRLASGEIYLDLTDLRSVEPITLAASVGVGRLVVLLPPDAGLTLDARVSGGRLSLFGGRQVGTTLGDRVEHPAGTGPPLVLTLEVGIGEVLVETGRDGG
jgi:phage shock protein PspC (stress-responsive transcriptional regulator)